jgi:Zn-dependent protease
MNGSLSLGRIAGVQVKAHWSTLIVAVLVWHFLREVVSPSVALVGTFGFLASIVLHEFGHALTARRFGIETESIQIFVLGGVARLARHPDSPKAEGWIAAAGPLTSLGLAIAGIGSWWAVGGRDSGSEYASMLIWLGVINAVLAAFNLLPGAPLDGGRILKAARWAWHGNRYRAMREAGRAGQVLGWALVGLGLVWTLRGGFGLSWVLMGMFIALNARVEIASAAIGERLDGVTVGDLTWYGVAAAGTDMDADSMLWDRRRLGMAGGVAVTDGAGRPQGIVLEDEMWAVPAEQRPWVMLTQLMVPFDRVAQAAPDEELTSVLPRLNPARPMVTVWQNGKLVGLVSPKRLRDRLATP